MEKLSYLPKDILTPVWDNEQLQKICHFLNQKYKLFLENEYFEIEASFSKDRVQLLVSIVKNDNSIAYPIECICLRMDESPLSPSEISMIILDYLDVYWSEYLQEGREVFLPIDWSHHSMEGISFHLRGFIRHQRLEREADALFERYGYGEYDINPISSEL